MKYVRCQSRVVAVFTMCIDKALVLSSHYSPALRLDLDVLFRPLLKATAVSLNMLPSCVWMSVHVTLGVCLIKVNQSF